MIAATMGLWPWFSFEVRSAPPDDVQAALVELLVDSVEHPPFWVGDVAPRIFLGVDSGPRSKVRTTRLKQSTPRSIRQAVTRPRNGQLCSGQVIFGDDDPPDVWISITFSPQTTIGTVHLAAADDVGFGRAVMDVASLLVRAAGDVMWGCGWFGGYSSPPLGSGIGVVPNPGEVVGYSYLMCLPPSVVERVGGADRVRRGPPELVRDVVTASGQQCLITVLRDSPNDVSVELLLEWRAFLAPALRSDALESRQAAFDRLSLTSGSAWYQLPPMVLPDDWPAPP